jgi:hypothetical protein
MNDLATLNGKGPTITLDGREFRIAPLNFDDQGELQVWIDRQQRDPFAIVDEQIKSGRFSVEVQKFLAKSALEMARKSAPDLTRESLRELVGKEEERAFERAVAVADVLRADEDPKGPRTDGSTLAPPGPESPWTGGGSTTA